MIDRERIRKAHHHCVGMLLAERHFDGYFRGELSASALATALALAALAAENDPADRTRIVQACAWLLTDQNADGGWGDTPESPSNLPTTFLARCALGRSASGEEAQAAVARADEYLQGHARASGGALPLAIRSLYGDDSTFAAPILSFGALHGACDWSEVPPLPFELSVLPHGLLKLFNLGVVSYAMPALIAIGRAGHARRGASAPVHRLLRAATWGLSLKKLQAIQPDSGGYLEAIPLSAFVAVHLQATGEGDHPVAQRCREFLRSTQRDTGGWPIDTDLSVWLTSQACCALYDTRAENELEKTRDWLRKCQCKTVHPFTRAYPGGWPWTYTDGGVPDADDTAAAMLALEQAKDIHCTPAIRAGGKWLLHLQNRDGGWPTFCRGWRKLPFDSSAPDLTAHVLRALHACRDEFHPPLPPNPFWSAMAYLERVQREDGAWIPLWFGSQLTADKTNPVFGTARVLQAFAEMKIDKQPMTTLALDYLLRVQHESGGWGAAEGVEPTVEETAMALQALTHWPQGREACDRAAAYLTERIEREYPLPAAPIGLYFASLWYSERLYPILWSCTALKAYLDAR